MGDIKTDGDSKGMSERSGQDKIRVQARAEPSSSRVPIREDLFDDVTLPLKRISLMGTKCNKCGEVIFGKGVMCQSCTSDNLSDIRFSRKGTIYSYTVIRNRPPGDYKGPEPFVPYGVALVELPEGIRILSPLTGCDVEKWRIGMEVELVVEVLYKDGNGNDVMVFKFEPAES